MAEFLLEIGLEEVPARMIAGAEAELRTRVFGLLERERLLEDGAAVEGFATPRRLAVRVRGVKDRQEDVAGEMLGPAVKIAFPGGRSEAAGPAAVAFAKKAGVSVEELQVVETPKGEYVSAKSVKAGNGASEVLAAGLPGEIAGLYWAKSMSWRAGRPERFVRPVRWLVALLDGDVVPVAFGGYAAGRTTFGQRVLFGDQGMELQAPAEYAEALERGFVLAGIEARRHRIRKALDRVCRGVENARWREDHALVEKMTMMTEWPSVILGGFDAAYLDLPEEVLVTVMRDHQNYFAVEDKAGRLLPHFLAVLNTQAGAEGEAVIRHGNERVLRARFNDARFFWEFDQRVSLEERVALLEKVTFQRDLGSYGAKQLRVAEVARTLGWRVREQGLELDAKALEEAARLAKCDLTTELVKEFTELQGEIGGLYGRVQGLSEAACAAIYDQYRPGSMEERIPRTPEGQVLAIADKVDTIEGMFGLGMEPTGSRDPFALRRAANGIVRILAEGVLPLRLGEVVEASGAGEAVGAKMLAFFAERVEFYLREAKGQAYDVVKAVMAAGVEDLGDAVARAQAVTAMRGSEDFLAVSAAFKRMKNILAQAAEKGDVVEPAAGTPGGSAQEEGLRTAARTVSEQVSGLADRHEYGAALEAIASLRPAVDAYFDTVMVMDPEPGVRRNRLALLSFIVASTARIADFSEIVVAG